MTTYIDPFYDPFWCCEHYDPCCCCPVELYIEFEKYQDALKGLDNNQKAVLAREAGIPAGEIGPGKTLPEDFYGWVIDLIWEITWGGQGPPRDECKFAYYELSNMIDFPGAPKEPMPTPYDQVAL